MLSVNDSAELQAVTLAIKAANKNIRGEISKRTREELNPIWKGAIADHLSGRSAMTTRLLTGVRVAAGNPASAKAAQSKRALGKSKRLTPAQDFYIAEFGVNPKKVTTYSRKNRKTGGSHKVTRHVNVGKPSRIKNGRVVYPAFAEVAPRMVSLWVQTVVKVYAEAAEGKVV